MYLFNEFSVLMLIVFVWMCDVMWKLVFIVRNLGFGVVSIYG